MLTCCLEKIAEGVRTPKPPPPRYVHEANIWDCIVQFDFCYSLLHYFTEA